MLPFCHFVAFMTEYFLIALELTSEQSLTQKANYAREMARAVNSAQFKKKRLLAKKQAPKIEEKEKVENTLMVYT